jgi:hypothetical protein
MKVFLIALLLVLSNGSFGQERMVLGPLQFGRDTAGKGAVLCSWAIYISVQADTAACGRRRTPTDDAIDEAIIAIDDFIIANSSLKPTREMLQKFKRDAAEIELANRSKGGRNFCIGDEMAGFRNSSPEQIRAGVKEMLSVPREPVMNPCL